MTDVGNVLMELHFAMMQSVLIDQIDNARKHGKDDEADHLTEVLARLISQQKSKEAHTC